ncbi:MAG: hypothetical protein RSE13_15595 [Planktothrix sp. GU0601_MAG3]|nr:MAG: hypothetical protein RSE13_15595 [Planktothrix sp. GU0601_MAG3]
MNSEETQIRDQNPPLSGAKSSSTPPSNSAIGETAENSINMNPLPIADPWESNELQNLEPGSNTPTSPSLSERLMSETHRRSHHPVRPTGETITDSRTGTTKKNCHLTSNQ